MFINSKKCFEIREGDHVLVIPRDFIGSIPDWAARHWLVLAAIQDGSIATPDSKADNSLEEADVEAEGKAEQYDTRSVEEAEVKAEGPIKQIEKKTKS